MSSKRLENKEISEYIKKQITINSHLELIKSEAKEAIVFEEKEISYIYTLCKAGSDVTVTLTISDPLYFCDVIIAKNEKEYFPLKSYLETLDGDNELEKLFNTFIDEEIDAEKYTLNFLKIFKKYLDTNELQSILAGEIWPKVPIE